MAAAAMGVSCRPLGWSRKERVTDLRAWTRLRSENSWRSTKAFRVWRWSSSLEESV